MATSETNRTLPEYEVSQEQETELMNRYTREFTREHVFAVDLMTYAMEICNLEFENYIYPLDVGFHPSDLDGSIKKLIGFVVPKTTGETTQNLLGMTINLEDTNYAEFKCFANAASIRFGKEPYDEDYLGFCVGMASMCCAAYRHGITMAPNFGIMLMCRKYLAYLIKASVLPDPWQEIKSTAKRCVEWLETILRSVSE